MLAKVVLSAWGAKATLRERKGGHVSALRQEEGWQFRAGCRGPAATVFFPPPRFERKHERLSREAQAKAICFECPVQDECLEYALEIREPHGIWGGLNEAERKAILAERDDR
ncbi:MAG: WhiB family transcriptional regulator [Acidimicrobiia bacterium]|nr:WhiB family transcriptional regulator [Acidimicrobiia bacterium]